MAEQRTLITSGNDKYSYGETATFQVGDGLLRDLFAAFALTLGEGVWSGGHLPENADKLAANAYAVADAMLKARATQPVEAE